MELFKFRVTEFRSVKDSGWIDTGRITTFVGANESGKTNLMKALWKLNAGGDSEIEPVSDMPRQRYYALMAANPKPVFITAAFRLTQEEIGWIRSKTGVTVAILYAGRDYDNKLHIEFCESLELRDIPAELIAQGEATVKELENLRVTGADTGAQQKYVVSAMNELITPTQSTLAGAVHNMFKILEPLTNGASPALMQLIATVKSRDILLSMGLNSEIAAFVKEHMPKFLFYSSEANLDGELYLPQIKVDLARKNLRGHEVDRTRTAKKFFEILGKTPNEMLELGSKIDDALGEKKRAEEVALLKAQAESILNAAENKLNEVFLTWAGATEYKFDFKLDGEYIRVRVVDGNGIEPIELEYRSEWIQWMFSFCINLYAVRVQPHFMLLDEPELALHPLSQLELRRLLGEKSQTTQVIYSTHSPFFVDYRHLDRVVNVYVDENGYTATGEDLRSATRDAQIEAGFALTSAVTLGISDALLYGCVPVFVETVSDQIYLSTYKNLLAGAGELSTRREIVIIPCGGVTGVKAVLPLLVGKNNFLPAYVTGGDKSDVVATLIKELNVFSKHPNRAVTFGAESQSRIEDLVPTGVFYRVLARYMDEKGLPPIRPEGKGSIVARVEEAGKSFLPSNWREEMAQMIRLELIQRGPGVFEPEVGKWETIRTLFDILAKV